MSDQLDLALVEDARAIKGIGLSKGQLLCEREIMLTALRHAYTALYECSEDNPPDSDGPFWNEGGAGYLAFMAVNDALRTAGEEL